MIRLRLNFAPTVPSYSVHSASDGQPTMYYDCAAFNIILYKQLSLAEKNSLQFTEFINLLEEFSLQKHMNRNATSLGLRITTTAKVT